MKPPPWQRREKYLESLEVQGPVRRKLIQHRTQRAFEMARPREKQLQWIVRILQLLHVRQEAAGFDRIDEMRRRLRSPRVERARIREAIEGVVDFDSIEMLGI